MDQAEFIFFSKCKLNKQFNTLQYLVLGYKPGQDKYKDLKYILSLIGLSILRHTALAKIVKKYVNTTYIVKSEIIKAIEP